jgi:hypothetical protein
MKQWELPSMSVKYDFLKKVALELLNLPNLTANMYAVLRDVQTSADAVLTILRKPVQSRRAQIFVLWTSQGGDRAPFAKDEPCFWSWGFEIPERGRIITTGVVDVTIPPGAWMVAINCFISQVFIGNSLQDLGSGISNDGIPLRTVRLRDEIKLGNAIKFNVSVEH